MNKPTKFRAWVPQLESYGEVLNIHFSEEGIPEIIEVFINGSNHHLNAFEFVLEQYTGLKDKNGKEIYEGDIVNIAAVVNTDDSDMTCIMDTNSVVCWDKGHVRWDVNDRPESEDWDYRRRRYFVFVDSDDRENVEVIGNIHENPELLGEEK